MTKKEIKDSHLSILEDGKVALTMDKGNGKADILRVMTDDEVTNLLMMSYLSHITQHPDQPMQVISLNDSQSLVVTIVDKSIAGNKE